MVGVLLANVCLYEPWTSDHENWADCLNQDWQD